MKHIAIFDAAAESGKTLKELGFNPTLYCAYRTSLDTGNDLIDFNEVIWDHDIKPIVDCLRSAGVTEFTISSTFSSLIETLAEFEKQGCRMQGLMQVKARYTDWRTGEQAIIPAIRMAL